MQIINNICKPRSTKLSFKCPNEAAMTSPISLPIKPSPETLTFGNVFWITGRFKNLQIGSHPSRGFQINNFSFGTTSYIYRVNCVRNQSSWKTENPTLGQKCDEKSIKLSVKAFGKNNKFMANKKVYLNISNMFPVVLFM